MLLLKTIKDRFNEINKIPNDVDVFTSDVLFHKENNKVLRSPNEEIYYPRFSSSLFPKQGQSLFRITSFYPSIDITKESSFHHPPVNLTTSQRCNLPKKPVFYCSDNPFFSLLETLQGRFENALGKLFYLSEWKASVSKEWKTLGIMFGEMPEKNSYFLIREKYIATLEKLYNEKLGIGQFKEYNDFLYEEFVKEGNHTISSHVAHNFLYENVTPKNDLIIYPSVQGNRYNCNLAFNTENIENSNIKLERIFSFILKVFKKVDDLKYEYEFEPVSIAQCGNGKISNWKMMDDGEIERFKKMF